VATDDRPGGDRPSSRPNLARVTVLVVEDDTDSRAFLVEVLRTCGATVVEADNVRTAQEFMRTLKVHLVVTDLAMPGVDGAAFLRWLREQPSDQGGNVPAVAVTAFYEQYPPAELSGCAAYFRKPVDIDDFVRTVARILGRG
jgi:CheY-like chemotaxis protein